mmetsp:Transcript_69244/g.212297  ORF Transcript_69244/g.212297 Transcript_69244/m.212297 type:complete len:187 (+) Transcript_69244:578-1138(+)
MPELTVPLNLTPSLKRSLEAPDAPSMRIVALSATSLTAGSANVPSTTWASTRKWLSDFPTGLRIAQEGSVSLPRMHTGSVPNRHSSLLLLLLPLQLRNVGRRLRRRCGQRVDLAPEVGAEAADGGHLRGVRAADVRGAFDALLCGLHADVLELLPLRLEDHGHIVDLALPQLPLGRELLLEVLPDL